MVDRLVHLLDINKESIEVYFSGNEGFHVHVYGEKFQSIGQSFFEWNSRLPV